jgi:hypothetical protein
MFPRFPEMRAKEVTIFGFWLFPRLHLTQSSARTTPTTTTYVDNNQVYDVQSTFQYTPECHSESAIGSAILAFARRLTASFGVNSVANMELNRCKSIHHRNDIVFTRGQSLSV